ncbi:ATP-dependent helicase [Bacillus sp. FJAT-29937]|uniref:ATP-dependent helicase n=1 Tax=Bacillus sp. FJAT-29937 TaxID=1720553 RepID=UPI00082EF30A|nr:ATP-dependent helicase [Bacillus sp. FJAT-29937]
MFVKEKQGFKFPLNSTKGKLPIAEVVVNKSTVDLVDNSEIDSFFFRSLEKEGIYLTKDQLQAVRAKNGPHLVIAGAGSGKTRVLTSRTAYLLNVLKVPANAIMLLSFTQKAANEMIERISKLPGISRFNPEQIVAGTFHSVFLKLLRSQGYAQKILSSNKQKEILIQQVLKEMNIKDTYEPESLLTFISSYKNKMMKPHHIQASTLIEKEIKEIYYLFEKRKEQQNLMEFSDILLESVHLLKHNEELREQLQNRFQYICVDEFQDCNLVQKELIKMILNPVHENLLVVGDEDQCIYHFSGSEIGIILNLKNEFPNLTQITLDTNYRSIDSIVGLGNSLIRHNKNRLGKVLKSVQPSTMSPLYMRPYNADHEAKLIVQNIISEVTAGKRAYSDFAVLYRTHSLSRAILDELTIQGIPFIAHGSKKSFYENPLIQPILSYLKLSLDPNNIKAIVDIAPTLYLNKENVEQHLMKFAHSERQLDYLGLLLGIQGMKPYHKEQVFNRIDSIKKLKSMRPKEAIQFIRKGPFRYEEYLDINKRKTLTLSKEWITDALDELETAAEKFQTIEEFVSFINQIIPKQKDMDDNREDAIHLMTMHSSKGLEFPCVYLLGVVDGILPHKAIDNANGQTDRREAGSTDKQHDALEEERRIAYVAVSRAKEELIISSPKNYRGKSTSISRFLVEAFSN